MDIGKLLKMSFHAKSIVLNQAMTGVGPSLRGATPDFLAVYSIRRVIRCSYHDLIVSVLVYKWHHN